VSIDIAVVGASTAGLLVARELALKGLRVAVYEARKHQEPARRTLIVTPALNRVLGHVSDQVILHKIDVLRLCAGGECKNVRLQHPDFIVERGQLTAWLQRQVEALGVEIHHNCRFVNFETRQAETLLRFRNGGDEFCERVTRGVVGADGVASDVGRAAGIPRPPSVPILQAEIDLPARWHSSTTAVWFDIEQTKFFFWLLPESERRGVVGLIGDANSRVRELLNQFLATWEFVPGAYQGARVALYDPRIKPWTRVGHLPVYLVGDSAGQVKVTTVGGTVTGFAGARAVAQALLENRSYCSCLRSVKRELDLHYWIRRQLDRLTGRDYVDLIRALNPAVLEFLGTHDRDSMAPVLWRLPLLEPGLMRIGLRSLWRRSTNRETFQSTRIDEASEHPDV